MFTFAAGVGANRNVFEIPKEKRQPAKVHFSSATQMSQQFLRRPIHRCRFPIAAVAVVLLPVVFVLALSSSAIQTVDTAGVLPDHCYYHGAGQKYYYDNDDVDEDNDYFDDEINNHGKR